MNKFRWIVLIIIFLVLLVALYWASGRILGLRYYMASGMSIDTMSPTLQKDIQFRLYPYKNILYKLSPSYAYKLQHGDIISFSNEATKQLLAIQGLSPTNFVGRVIALPNDTIEIKGGIVFLNGKPLDESYILTPNTTHVSKIQFKGKVYGDFLSECKLLKIPSNKLFVLVDNRENGDDSRVVGLVDLNDIDAYLPLKVQKEGYAEGSNFIKYSDSWRQPNTTLTQDAVKNASVVCK